MLNHSIFCNTCVNNWVIPIDDISGRLLNFMVRLLRFNDIIRIQVMDCTVSGSVQIRNWSLRSERKMSLSQLLLSLKSLCSLFSIWTFMSKVQF
jgi:hypothetical protein